MGVAVRPRKLTRTIFACCADFHIVKFAALHPYSQPRTAVAEEKESRSSIQVIDRMMTLLNALAEQSEPMNLKLLAQATQLHPSTAHRILNVMVRNRMVDRIEPGTYCLGPRLLEFGALVRERNGDAAAMQPPAKIN